MFNIFKQHSRPQGVKAIKISSSWYKNQQHSYHRCHLAGAFMQRNTGVKGLAQEPNTADWGLN